MPQAIIPDAVRKPVTSAPTSTVTQTQQESAQSSNPSALPQSYWNRQEGSDGWQPVATPKPEPSKQDFLGFVGAVVSNPVGFASAIIKPVSKVVAKDTSPIGTIENLYIGAAGEMLNQYDMLGRVISGKNMKNPLTASTKNLLIVKPESEPVTEQPFVAQSPVQGTGQTAFRIGELATVAVAAPVLAPHIGLSSGSILLGEGLSIGINQASKAIQGGGLLTPEEVAFSAAEGGVFTIIGAKSTQLMGVGGKGLRPALGRIGINTIEGVITGDVSERITTGKSTGQGALQGGAFGLAFGAGGEALGYAGGRINAKYDVTGKVKPWVPKVKFEKASFVDPDYEAFALTLYKHGDVEPTILAYVAKVPDSSFGDGFNYKFGFGTPKIDPYAYSHLMEGLNYPSAISFESPMDVKIYQKGLKAYDAPSLEQENFALSKDLIYTAQNTKIPQSAIPKTLVIDTKTDPFIGQAASDVLTSPDFKGVGEYFGSSSFRSVLGEGRLGADVDLMDIPNEAQLTKLGSAMAGKANELSGTRNYVFKEGDVYNQATNMRLTDLHLQSEPSPQVDPLKFGSRQKTEFSKGVTFGLNSKDAIDIEGVRVMDPTETIVRKGSSALTPFKFQNLADRLDVMETPFYEQGAKATINQINAERIAQGKAPTTITLEGMKEETRLLNTRLTKEQPAFSNYITKQLAISGTDEFYGTSPRVLYGRGKDVTDFLAESQILNEAFFKGSKTPEINRLIDIYAEKGLTTPAKVQQAIKVTAPPDIMEFATALPSRGRSSYGFVFSVPKTSPTFSLISANIVYKTMAKSQSYSFPPHPDKTSVVPQQPIISLPRGLDYSMLSERESPRFSSNIPFFNVNPQSLGLPASPRTTGSTTPSPYSPYRPSPYYPSSGPPSKPSPPYSPPYSPPNKSSKSFRPNYPSGFQHTDGFESLLMPKRGSIGKALRRNPVTRPSDLARRLLS